MSAAGRVPVRSGSHCYEDFVYNADVHVVIDLSAMNRVGRDEQHDAFAVEPGATLWEVYGAVPGLGRDAPLRLLRVGGRGRAHPRRRVRAAVPSQHRGPSVRGRGGRNRLQGPGARWPGHPRGGRPASRPVVGAHRGEGAAASASSPATCCAPPGACGLPAERQLPRPPGQVYVQSLFWPLAGLTERDVHVLLHSYGTFFEWHSAPDSAYAAMSSKLCLSTAASGGMAMFAQTEATRPAHRSAYGAFVGAVADCMSELCPVTSASAPLPWPAVDTYSVLPGALRARRRGAWRR